MFRSKTAFIIGAGASHELGLPTGGQLKDIISALLSFKFDWDRLLSGNASIMAAIIEYTSNQNEGRGNPNHFFESAIKIAKALPQAISIDNFVDAHRGDKTIELCGKLSIVKSILDAEQRSKLHLNENREIHYNPSTLEDTWLLEFIKLLTEGVSNDNVETIFDNVSFIIFNYDRCIEHFLSLAIPAYYKVTDRDAQEIINNACIYHPYGAVGKLPWQSENGLGIPFGSSTPGSQNILKISQQIKTFTEQLDDQAAINAIRQAVADAETVVFLGFAYHRQNMDIIKPTTATQIKRVFGTAYGISKSDCEIVASDIRKTLQSRNAIKLEIRNDLTCLGLFGEFWRSLSSA